LPVNDLILLDMVQQVAHLLSRTIVSCIFPQYCPVEEVELLYFDNFNINSLFC
jgi:hypothetical protein